jgi:hypothetical protein
MDSGTVHGKKATHDVSQTNQRIKAQRVIIVLFMLALISLGVFVVLKLILGRTP